MLIVFLVVLVVVSVPLTGGRLSTLGGLHVRLVPALFAALAIQILIISVIPDVGAAVAVPAHIGSYLLAGWFFFANRRVPGLWLAGAGGGANFAAIAANGGVMPAGAQAFATSGRPVAEAGHFINSTPLADARLQFLGDIFTTPSWMPFSNVYSVGDVLIVVGTAVALYRICGSRLMPARYHRPPARWRLDAPIPYREAVRPS